jgi:hypothetical protein
MSCPNKVDVVPRRLWVITKDVIGEGVPKHLLHPNAKGGTKFRLKDDDGELMYEGRFYGDSRSMEAFSPLNWAQSNVGATEIWYLEGNKWELL